MGTTDEDRARERDARGIDEEDPEPCRACGGGRRVLVPRTAYVSRDMAIDAGDLALEGMPMDDGEEWVDCPECRTPGPPPAPRAVLDDLDLPF